MAGRALRAHKVQAASTAAQGQWVFLARRECMVRLAAPDQSVHRERKEVRAPWARLVHKDRLDPKAPPARRE